MVGFVAVSEVLAAGTGESSEGEYSLDESPLACEAKTLKGHHNFYRNISDGSWSSAWDCSTDASPSSGESHPWLFAKEGRLQSMVVVKNTFIDGYTDEDDDSDAGPPVAASKSCPVLSRSVSPSDSPGGWQTRARTVQLLESEAAEAGMESLAVMGSGELAREPFAAHTPPATFAGEEECLQMGHEVSQAVVDLEFRGPSMSVGSTMHELEECRPCAWYWRPQGCDNGQNCRHCHLCPRGALKARRRSKMSSARKQERADRAVLDGGESKAVRVQLALGSLI